MKSENCLVCFLDLLGYAELVRQKQASDVLAEFREQIYILKRAWGHMPSVNFALAQIHSHLLSDALIFVLDLNKVPEQDRMHCIRIFFLAVTSLSIELTVKLGFFFRGGVAVGQYFQEQVSGPENQFIFSKALVDANALQKKLPPKILISKQDYEQLKLQEIVPFIVEGDNYYYLDTYDLHKSHPDFKDNLMQITRHLGSQVRTHLDRSEIIEKYKWYSEYHNRKVKQLLSEGFLDSTDDLIYE